MTQKESEMISSRKRFSNNLKEIREERKLSQKEVAEKMGVPVSTYANWEQGRREPSIGDIFSLLKVLEIDANDLFNTI